MEPKRRVLLGDGLGAAAVLVAGLSALDGEVGPVHVLAAVGTAVGIATLWYAVERGRFEGWRGELFQIGAVVLAPFAVALALVLVGRPAIGPPLAGLGGGILVYRVAYGVVRPVPEYRLERARDGGA